MNDPRTLTHGTSHAPLAVGAWTRFIAIAAVLRFALAAFVTDFVLVDDAYITLRYARNAAETGALVYNAGEPVFGVTSPLWAFVTAILHACVGRAGIEMAVVALGIILWSFTARRLVSLVEPPYRAVVVTVFTCAPVFVDNQWLGMETPLFVWLIVHAVGAALDGRLRAAAIWTGWLVVARPEGVLFAPALLWAAVDREGWRATRAQLTRPLALLALLGPGLAWIAFATVRYGSVVPQSMVAKSGWNSVHYDAIGTLENAWLGVARLTFVPWIDYLPRVAALIVAGVVIAAATAVVLANIRAGSRASRAWAIVYVTYVVFFLAGRGATEASWYAVPSSLALLLAAQPSVPVRWAASRSLVGGGAAILVLASLHMTVERGRLLRSYVEGYGACADELERIAGPGAHRVLIGEIGVFGFRSSHTVVDVGALVSPEVLTFKNDGCSLVGLARATDVNWIVVNDVAVRENSYPTVGEVWATPGERGWWESSSVAFEACGVQLRRWSPNEPDTFASSNAGGRRTTR